MRQRHLIETEIECECDETRGEEKRGKERRRDVGIGRASSKRNGEGSRAGRWEEGVGSQSEERRCLLSRCVGDQKEEGDGGVADVGEAEKRGKKGRKKGGERWGRVGES